METAISGPQTARFLNDRMFFLFMAALMLVTAIIGFTPNSVAILSGSQPMPPLLVHLHAALMLAWLLLLLTQSGLIAAGNVRLHRRLGQAAIGLIPAIVVVMIAITLYRFVGDGEVSSVRLNVLLLQIRSVVLFPLFTAWALAARKYDLAFHKRLMIIATIVPLDAAIARTISRVEWLPGVGAQGPDFELMSAYQLSLMVPIALYDFWSNGRVHRATMLGLGLFGVSAIIVNLLWGSDWWLAVSGRFASLL